MFYDVEKYVVINKEIDCAYIKLKNYKLLRGLTCDSIQSIVLSCSIKFHHRFIIKPITETEVLYYKISILETGIYKKKTHGVVFLYFHTYRSTLEKSTSAKKNAAKQDMVFICSPDKGFSNRNLRIELKAV